MGWRNYISLFVSGLALLVSLGCLCHILPRELGIDYLGWIGWCIDLSYDHSSWLADILLI